MAATLFASTSLAAPVKSSTVSGLIARGDCNEPRGPHCARGFNIRGLHDDGDAKDAEKKEGEEKKDGLIKREADAAPGGGAPDYGQSSGATDTPANDGGNTDSPGDGLFIKREAQGLVNAKDAAEDLEVGR